MADIVPVEIQHVRRLERELTAAKTALTEASDQVRSGKGVVSL